MHLVPIFVNQETEEGLYSMVFDGESKDEYNKNLDKWADSEYVLNYLIANIKYIETAYFENATPDDIASKVDEEALELEINIKDYFHNCGKTLQMLFVPLGKQHTIPPHQKTKAFVDKSKFKSPILRMYAIRIDKNTFVITGGAIKLVEKMDDHEDTRKELEKLESAKKFLEKNDFNSNEDLILTV